MEEKQMDMFKEIEINYLDVSKNESQIKSFKIPYRWLETIVEMAFDYKIILENKLKNEELSGYNKALYIYKAKEIEKIALNIAEKINYNKSCQKAKNKKVDDVGADAFELMTNGYKNRGEIRK